MDNRDKALRAQDIQSGLQGLSETPVIVDAEIETTALIGMAGRLATHIRGGGICGRRYSASAPCCEIVGNT